MFAGWKTVTVSVVVMSIVGAIFGVIIGTLVDNYLITVPVLAFLGANFGIALAYGFLPEAPADLDSDPTN